MAYDAPCDICGQEPTAQLLTNLADGAVLGIGTACLPQFYGNMTLELFEAGEHKGPATKCQACRRFHERMTTPIAPIGTETDVSRETTGPSAGAGQEAATS